MRKACKPSDPPLCIACLKNPLFSRGDEEQRAVKLGDEEAAKKRTRPTSNLSKKLAIFKCFAVCNSDS